MSLAVNENIEQIVNNYVYLAEVAGLQSNFLVELLESNEPIKLINNNSANISPSK